jgi:hypothetical protein
MLQECYSRSWSIEHLKRKAAQKPNGAKQILPPNILKEGDINIKIGNGQIVI